MDTEEVFEKNNNNIEKYVHNLNPQLQNQLTAQQHHHHHNHQQMQSHNEQQHQQPQQQQQHLYHQQQHYQGHLHRANRDVSRSMLSHMI